MDTPRGAGVHTALPGRQRRAVGGTLDSDLDQAATGTPRHGRGTRSAAVRPLYVQVRNKDTDMAPLEVNHTPRKSTNGVGVATRADPTFLSKLGQSIRTTLDPHRKNQILHDESSRKLEEVHTTDQWRPPDADAAKAHQRATTFMDGSANVWQYKHNDLKALGSGIAMYFWTLRRLGWMLLLASVFMLPTLMLARAGTRIREQDMDLFGMARYSVGNIGYYEPPECSVEESLNITVNQNNCPNADFVNAPVMGDIRSTIAAFVVGLGDIGVVMVYLAFVASYRWQLKAMAEETSEDTEKITNASTYSVFVQHLPKKVTEAQLRRHFSALYRLDRPDWYWRGYCRCIGRKTARPPYRDFHRFEPMTVGGQSQHDDDNGAGRYLSTVNDVSYNGDAQYYGSWVVDVTIVKKNSHEVRLFLNMQTLAERVQRAQARVAMYSEGTLRPDGPDLVKRDSARARLNKLNAKLRTILMRVGKLTGGDVPGRRSSVATFGSQGVSGDESDAGGEYYDDDDDESYEDDGTLSTVSARTAHTGAQWGGSLSRAIGQRQRSSRKKSQIVPMSSDGQDELRGAATVGNQVQCPTVPPPPGPALGFPTRSGKRSRWDTVRHVYQMHMSSGFMSENERQARIRRLRARQKYRMADAVLDVLAAYEDALRRGASAEHRGAGGLFHVAGAGGGTGGGHGKHGGGRRTSASHGIGQGTEMVENPLAAFVVFNYAESQRRCVEDYKGSRWWLGRAVQPPPLRMDTLDETGTETGDTHPINVEAAAEPSTILWENLETSSRNRSMRRVLTFVFAAIVLVLSFLAIYFAQRARRIFINQVPETRVCSVELVAHLVGSTRALSVDEAELPVMVPDPTRNYACTSVCLPPSLRCPEPGQSFLVFREAVPVASRLGTYVYDISEPDPCRSPCVSKDDTTLCDSVTGLAPFEASLRLPCYCSQELQQWVAASGALSGGVKFMEEESELCKEFAFAYVVGQALRVVISVVFITVNFLIRRVMRALVAFERHNSASSRDSALTWKLFVGGYLHTAVWAMLMFANLPFKVELPIKGFTLFDGEFAGLPPEWYAVVGSYLTVTVLVDALSPSMLTLGRIALLPVKQRCRSRQALSQEEMNRSFEGPAFDLPMRLSGVLNILFVTITYCSGLPILLPITAVTFVLLYWVDKAAVLKFYKKPPHHSLQLGRALLDLLPNAMIFNLLVACWVLGDDDTLKSNVLDPEAQSDGSIKDSITKLYLNFLRAWLWGNTGQHLRGALHRQAVLPVFAGLTFVVIGFMLYKLFGLFSRAVKAIRNVMAGTEGLKVVKKADREVTKKQRGWFCRWLRPMAGDGDGGRRGGGRGGDSKAIDFLTGMSDEYAQWLGQYWGKKHQRLNYDVEAKDRARGWRLEVGQDGFVWLTKVWLEDGEVNGLRHRKGQRKRTWEILRDEGVHTYHMEDNEAYKYALKTQQLIVTQQKNDQIANDTQLIYL